MWGWGWSERGKRKKERKRSVKGIHHNIMLTNTSNQIKWLKFVVHHGPPMKVIHVMLDFALLSV